MIILTCCYYYSGIKFVFPLFFSFALFYCTASLDFQDFFIYDTVTLRFHTISNFGKVEDKCKSKPKS